MAANKLIFRQNGVLFVAEKFSLSANTLIPQNFVKLVHFVGSLKLYKQLNLKKMNSKIIISIAIVFIIKFTLCSIISFL